MPDFVCPSCGSPDLSLFYSVKHAPVHSVLLLPTREEAMHYPVGQIQLGMCETCGFITNVTFEPQLQHEYAGRYEATQAYSSTFNAFARQVALDLIERYNLHGKTIIEVGCGQGEFLIELCELGGNYGIGFDPAYRGEPFESEAKSRLTFIPDFYSEQYTHHRADFVCCKMTLEHIPQTYEFVSTVRRSIGDHNSCVVFFQVPNAGYVLRDVAFWDVYYEHCSYFSRGALVHLFERCGFDVLRAYTMYDDQYLMIEAKAGLIDTPVEIDSAAVQQTRAAVNHFVTHVNKLRDHWRTIIDAMVQQRERAVIWGGGSKGVAFLTTLKIYDQIQYVVDINPKKQGMFMAGTGQEIVSPDFLNAYQPDVVIVMNPIYCAEIQALLNERGVSARLLSL